MSLTFQLEENPEGDVEVQGVNGDSTEQVSALNSLQLVTIRIYMRGPCINTKIIGIVSKEGQLS